MKNKKISVVMATYNHEKYVTSAIKSVLKQSNVELEFLISDDGSSDNTANVINRIKDPRINFTENLVNRGACTVLNELISKSSGDYIAIMNSDDIWSTHDKLYNQLKEMDNQPNIAACFGNAKYIDKNNKTSTTNNIFQQENRSQGKWLRYFFEYGNCLCHPTILIKKQCYTELGNYNNNYRQLPDYEMWVRLLKKHPIHISNETYIDFRLTPGNNTSSNTTENSIRIMNEHFLIAGGFFDGISKELIIDGFSDLLKIKDIPSEIHLEIEKTMLLFAPIKGLNRPYKMQGLIKLNNLMLKKEYREILLSDYGIDGFWFQTQTAQTDILRPKIKAIISQHKNTFRRIINKILRPI